MTTASVQTDGHLDGPHLSLPPTTQSSDAVASSSSSVPSPAHDTSPEELSSLLFSSSNGQLEDAFDLSQLDAAAFGSSGGKKRGRKLAPATGDKRREANRAAQRSFRERKVQHVKELEMQVNTFEGQKRRVAHLVHGLVQENAKLRHGLGQDPQTLQELLEQYQGFEIDLPKPSSCTTLSSSWSGTALSPSKSPRSLSERLSRSPSPQAEPSKTSTSTPLPSYPPHPPTFGAGAPRPSLTVPSRQPPPRHTNQVTHMHIPAMPVMQPEFFLGDAPPRPQPVPNLHHGPAGSAPAVAGISGDLSHVSSSSIWHPAMLPACAGSFPPLGEQDQLNRHQRSPTFLPGLHQSRPQQQHQNHLPPSLQFPPEPHTYPHHPWTGPPG